MQNKYANFQKQDHAMNKKRETKNKKSPIPRKMTDQESRVSQQRIAHILNIYSYIHR